MRFGQNQQHCPWVDRITFALLTLLFPAHQIHSESSFLNQVPIALAHYGLASLARTSLRVGLPFSVLLFVLGQHPRKSLELRTFHLSSSLLKSHLFVSLQDPTANDLIIIAFFRFQKESTYLMHPNLLSPSWWQKQGRPILSWVNHFDFGKYLSGCRVSFHKEPATGVLFLLSNCSWPISLNLTHEYLILLWIAPEYPCLRNQQHSNIAVFCFGLALTS